MFKSVLKFCFRGNEGGIYQDHLEERKTFMEAGVGRYDIDGQQKYNLEGTLGLRKNSGSFFCRLILYLSTTILRNRK